MQTWKQLIDKAFQIQVADDDYDTEIIYRDSWDNVVKCTLSNEELELPFDSGYGCINGKPFTLWTQTRVYFPVVYDGSEWVASVPRNPCDEACEHVGG